MVDSYVTAARPWRPAQQLSSVPYLPGLDGLRALAVVAVMVYHANSDWLHGGFLGVEVFFVISGYLITLLLMAEQERTGRIDLVGFWIRRMRRLLPALYLMLFLLLTYTAFFKANTLGQLRGDLIAGVAYVSNWYQIWVGQGYSASGDFAPLRHLWSLAVEEQFYIVWPAVMMLVLRRGTRKLASCAMVLFILAVTVNVVVAVLYQSGRIGECDVTPEAYWSVGERCLSKADGLYLSTVTRSGGLLLGSAFAMVWRPIAILRGPVRHAGRSLDIASLLALVALVGLCWKVQFLGPQGPDPWLFRGGFFAAGVATLVLIAAATHRYALAGKVLGNRLFAYVGTRSYGLYLYHWPIYQIIRKIAGNTLTLTQFVTAMAITLVLTELSYTYVETPIRRREVANWWAGLRRRRDPMPRQTAVVAALAVLALLAFGTIRLGVADLSQNAIAQSLDEGAEFTNSVDDLIVGSGTTQPAAPAVISTVPGAATPVETVATTLPPTTTTTLPKEPVDFLAIGDSVMQGAAGVLSERGYFVDAAKSRQLTDVIASMQNLQAHGLIGDPVVIHLGTNGTITAAELDTLLDTMPTQFNVLLLTVRANRSWTAGNNAIIRAAPSQHPNVAVIDWEALSNNCTGGCFGDDGIHLTATGAKFYADQIGEYTGKME